MQIIYILFLCLVSVGLHAQVTLSTQAEVDAWDQSITELTGRVTISGSDITNIDAFSSVTSLSGRLEITENIVLTNIDGLSGLTSLDGTLSIGTLYNGNASLINIDGLSSLSIITGTLNIVENASLTNIDALSGLTSLGGELVIQNNIALTNIDGLSGMTSIPKSGRLTIEGNDALPNIDGLSGLTSIEGSLNIGDYFAGNNALTNINGLSGLTSLEGQLNISDNAALTNIDGLSGLTSITGFLGIGSVAGGNAALTNIDGLSSLVSLEAGGGLTIEGNSSLLNINGLSGLTSLEGQLKILGNAALTNIDGLSGVTSITDTGVLVIGEWVSGNPALINVDGLSGLTSLEGELQIEGNGALANIDGLSGLASLEGELVIADNAALANIDGLSQLTSITNTGALFIGTWNLGNDALININALSGLTSLEGELNIEDNAALANIDGLSGVTSIMGSLVIIFNSALTNIDGLSGLTSLGGDLSIEGHGALTNIDGLSGLTSLEGRLNIEKNDALTNIDGLSGITTITITGILTIGSFLNGNGALTNIDGLSGLTSINGVLNIEYNRQLADCCILKDVPGNIQLEGNDTGCSSLQEIQEADCGLEVNVETNPPCLNVDNGSIILYASNYDTIPFDYMWINDIGQSGSGTSIDDVFSIEGLASANYEITVDQPNGESKTVSNIMLTPNPGISLDLIGLSTVSAFNGLPNGSLTADFSGGTPPYDLTLAGPTTVSQTGIQSLSHTFDNLSPGDYNLILEDSEGSTTAIEVTILDESIDEAGCVEPLDIIILNLVSKAISAKEYGNSKTYFHTFFENLNLGTGNTDSQVAIVEWSGKNDQALKIPITGDLSTLGEYQRMDRSFSGSTDIIYALKFGYEYLRDNGRADAQDVIIFTYDGCPGFSGSEYAEELKEKGIIIADIGIDYVSRSSTYQRILRQAATEEDMAYFARDFDQLDPLELYIDLTYANCSGTTSNIYFNRDGSLMIDDIGTPDCPNPGFVDLTFSVTAHEQLSLPIGTPVSFYHNDPTQYGATLISTFLLPCSLPAGESETFTVSLPIETATHLYAVLNDDGETPPSFQLPVTEIPESLYANNIDDIRICTDVTATVQALKASVSLYPICENIVQYNLDLCNISTLDATGVSYTDVFPTGAVLTAIIVNTNGCATDNGNNYDLPAGCCVSLTLSYDISSTAPGYYGDQDVLLTGPNNQTYLDFDGATTSAEDILLNGQEDCGDPTVTFSKEVSHTTTCVDHSLTYTFTIDNKSSTPLYGLQFTDMLPAPLEWVYKPYQKEGLSITVDDFLEGQNASFIIDRIDAETVATFVIDVYVGETNIEVTANNTARIDGLPDYINGGVDFLASNTTTTTILADIEVTTIDTLTILASDMQVDLSALVGGTPNISWSTSGDGTFSNNTILDPTYTLGTEDMIDPLIGLTLDVETYCGDKSQSVFIKRECNLALEPILPIEICQGQPATTTLNWTGGIGPFTLFETGQDLGMNNLTVIEDLTAGFHRFTIRDAMDCEAEIQLTINSISGPQTAFGATEEHCDQGDGSLTLDITSGIGPYTIVGNQTWTDVNDQLVLSDLTGGDYNFTITDSQGCSSEEIFSVQVQAAPEVQESVTQPGCDEMEGSVILEWPGVTGNYNIDGDISAQNISLPYNLDQLAIGSYEITLSDAFGCEDEIAFDIIENPAPEASASTTCIDSTMYSVQLSTGDFDIASDLGLVAISAGQNAYEINNIPVDETIIITVTDPANGCNKFLTITPPDCSCSAKVEVGDDQEITCYQESVILDASASSQGSDYSYAWYDSNENLVSTENQYETDQEGTYTFEITDLVYSCTVIRELTVTDIRNTPEASIISSEQVLTCKDDSLELSVNAEANVRYIWQHLVTGEDIIGTEITVGQAGQLQLSVLDTLTGCNNNDMLLIEIDTVTPVIILIEPLLLNCENTSVNIDASGSDQGDFIWLDSNFDQLAESSQMLITEESGIFYYQLENRTNGCVSTDSVIVNSNYAVPDINLEDEISLNCKEEEVAISPDVISDHEYDLEWILNQQTISAELNLVVSEPGIYAIELKDKVSACKYTDTIEVLPSNEIQTVGISQSDIFCYGDHSGVIEIMNVEGGTPDYSYYLNQEPIEKLKIEELVSGEYNIKVVDAADCDYDTLITLTEPLSILVGPDLDEQIVNLGRAVEVNLETNLAHEDIAMVNWMPAIDCDNCLSYTFENVQEDLNYQITIVDKNNCEQSLDLRILVNSDIAVYLPNVINPNSDNNDVFFPQTSIDNITVREMNIFDRWGNLVFSSSNFPVNDSMYGWNGLINDGPAELGVYVYTIVLENDTETIQLSGDLTLLK